MDKNDATGSVDDPVLSHAHVEQILRRVGLDEKRIATVLDGIDFPSPLSRILPRLMEHGVSRTSLIDRMGGSP
jgi:hypothetical protein